jgi:5'-methylthioadenosine phosphorylase
VITGSGLQGVPLGPAEPVDVRGVTLHADGRSVVLARHGADGSTRPHEIDHAANLLALREAGVDRVLALGSVGSLRPDWPVGTVVCPDDFFAPHVTVSLFPDGRSYGVRGFDRPWREAVVRTWRAHAARPLVDGGVYGATVGPRFETPAEIRALARDADLVGMTLAAECIVAQEAGLAYAAVCVVDNLGNGLAPEPLTLEDFRAAAAANRAALVADLDRVLPHLAAAG